MKAARTSAGLLDVLLGKLIFRDDSAEFLNRLTPMLGTNLALGNTLWPNVKRRWHGYG